MLLNIIKTANWHCQPLLHILSIIIVIKGFRKLNELNQTIATENDDLVLIVERNKYLKSV
jgi:hypothetical protein